MLAKIIHILYVLCVNQISLCKGLGMLSTDCKNQSLRDRVDYKFDGRLQSSEFREPDFFVD